MHIQQRFLTDELALGIELPEHIPQLGLVNPLIDQSGSSDLTERDGGPASPADVPVCQLELASLDLSFSQSPGDIPQSMRIPRRAPPRDS